MPRYDDVEVGTVLPEQTFPIQRVNLDPPTHAAPCR